MIYSCHQVIETGIQLMQQVVNGQGIIVHGRTLMG
jgi:hypothetical protein